MDSLQTLIIGSIYEYVHHICDNLTWLNRGLDELIIACNEVPVDFTAQDLFRMVSNFPVLKSFAFSTDYHIVTSDVRDQVFENVKCLTKLEKVCIDDTHYWRANESQ